MDALISTFRDSAYFLPSSAAYSSSEGGYMLEMMALSDLGVTKYDHFPEESLTI